MSFHNLFKLQYIFEFKKINLGDIANSFFTLKVPKIKETNNKKYLNFKEYQGNIEDVPFKDPN